MENKVNLVDFAVFHVSHAQMQKEDVAVASFDQNNLNLVFLYFSLL